MSESEPQPLRGNMGASIIGPTNPARGAQSRGMRQNLIPLMPTTTFRPARSSLPALLTLCRRKRAQYQGEVVQIDKSAKL
jgi:hypothetical protein